MTKNEEIDWSSVTEPMARQILAQAQTYLQCQWQAGIAADQRAVTTASILITTSTAVTGGAIAYGTASHPDLNIVAAGFIAGWLLLLGAILCFWSARPEPFFSPGNEPSQWWPIRHEDLVKSIGGETENLQKHIEYNNKVLADRSRWFNYGVVAAVTAPLASSIYFAAVTFF